jgi:hypothetical protein
MNEPMYRGSVLKRNSKAFEMWEAWQKTKDNKERKALDDHMKRLDVEAKDLMARYPSVD